MPAVYDFDPDLASLHVAFDLDAVARMFERRWPAGELPPGSVTAHKLLDTKYEPRVSCVTTYDLEVPVTNGRGPRTIGALEMSPSHTTLRTLERDPQLPWLAQALDSATMAGRFDDLVEDRDDDLAQPAITAVRYKPGARCVIRYAWTAPERARVYFGKSIVAGAEAIAGRIAALQEASSNARNMPRVAGPVAYWADLRMLVQRAVEGNELHEVAFDTAVGLAERWRWMEEAGRGLAGLHSVVGVDAPARTMSDDLDELDGYASPMRQVDPELARVFERAVGSLRTHGALGPGSVCGHGAFRTDQFMIQSGELVLIDLDGLCRSEPERDLGNLFAYLRWKARRQPEHADFLAGAPERFLTGYGALRAAPDERRLALYEAASLLKIAGRRYRSLTVREWPKVPYLVDAATQLIDAA